VIIFSDFLNIGAWWLVFFSMGIAFIPLTTRIFSSFFDQGYIFSKIIALLFISYATWILGSLYIIPFSFTTLFIIWLFFLILNWGVLNRSRPVKISSWKTWLAEEVLFLTGFIFWAVIKGFEPSIHGLEKYMDFGFISSVLRSDYFPPKDIWMTPLSINYYYFGHLATAVLIKVSGVTSYIGYNLMLASLFGITLATSFSIGANLYQFFATASQKLHTIRYTLYAGLLSSFLVTLGGNLHTIYIFFQNYQVENPLPFWMLSPAVNFAGYWYPNATRFIPFTIHEFPIYSFVVSDLHGHVLNIPFVLLFIALLIKLFHSPQQSATRYPLYALFGLLIAVFLMTNILDAPIYLLVISLVIFIKQLTQSKKPFSLALLHTVYHILPTTLLALLLSLPYWLSFTPFSSGIGILCSPDFLVSLEKIGPFLFEANHCAHSPLWMLGILWGFPLFVIITFIFHLLPSKLKNLSSTFYHLSSVDKLVLTLASAAFILILIPEFFYAKDIYPAHYRANTVFKFGYQAFIILGLISGYMIIRILSLSAKTIRCTLYAIPLFILFSLVAIYPYFAINSYFGGLKNYQGLDGFRYFQQTYPDDYQAILWLRENIKGPAEGEARQGRQPVILEAQGDSYTDYARVSSNTGLPTVIGWPVHEWLWRGSYDEAGKRSGEVTTLYESPDINLTKKLLEKYNVEYVFIGALERQKYLNLNEDKFKNMGQVVFESGTTKIFKLN